MVILINFRSSTRVPLISVEHSLNRAQALNATFVFSLPPVTAIFSVTKIYESE